MNGRFGSFSPSDKDSLRLALAEPLGLLDGENELDGLPLAVGVLLTEGDAVDESRVMLSLPVELALGESLREKLRVKLDVCEGEAECDVVKDPLRDGEVVEVAEAEATELSESLAEVDRDVELDVEMELLLLVLTEAENDEEYDIEGDFVIEALHEDEREIVELSEGDPEMLIELELLLEVEMLRDIEMLLDMDMVDVLDVETVDVLDGVAERMERERLRLDESDGEKDSVVDSVGVGPLPDTVREAVSLFVALAVADLVTVPAVELSLADTERLPDATSESLVDREVEWDRVKVLVLDRDWLLESDIDGDGELLMLAVWEKLPRDRLLGVRLKLRDSVTLLVPEKVLLSDCMDEMDCCE